MFIKQRIKVQHSRGVQEGSLRGCTPALGGGSELKGQWGDGIAVERACAHGKVQVLSRLFDRLQKGHKEPVSCKVDNRNGKKETPTSGLHPDHEGPKRQAQEPGLPLRSGKPRPCTDVE